MQHFWDRFQENRDNPIFAIGVALNDDFADIAKRLDRLITIGEQTVASIADLTTAVNNYQSAVGAKLASDQQVIAADNAEITTLQGAQVPDDLVAQINAAAAALAPATTTLAAPSTPPTDPASSAQTVPTTDVLNPTAPPTPPTTDPTAPPAAPETPAAPTTAPDAPAAP